jgi:hypothetical protein
MAAKEWTSQADWETWSWTNGDTTTTPGSVTIAAGNTQAVGVSPVYEAANWAAGYWRALVLAGTQPEATSYYLRFRVGATAVACAAATYSEYINGIDSAGGINFNLRQWILNNPAWDVGPYIQIELTLDSD